MYAVDTETFLIEDGAPPPQLVCATFAYEDDGGNLQERIEHYCDAGAVFKAFGECAIAHGRPLVFANAAFDTTVLLQNYPTLKTLIWTLYEKGLIRDVQIRQRLIDIAEGRYRGFRKADGQTIKVTYRLDDLVRRHLGITMSKGEDTYRLRYAELFETEIRDWPKEAVDYAIFDATSTLAVYQKQEAWANLLENEAEQCRADFVLQLISLYGIRTDAEGLATFAAARDEELRMAETALVAAGLVRPNGTRDTKAAAARMVQVVGENYTRTAGGGVALDRESCNETEDPILMLYAEMSGIRKTLSADIPMLERGTERPIQTRFEVLLETGRTSSSNPNIQNVRRLPGIRECFVPRPGFVFIDCDYSMLELYTWAFVCRSLFGFSKMAEVLLSGRDPHLEVAAIIQGISYDEAKKLKEAGDETLSNNRDCAKVANFGLPGGLGIRTFIDYAATSYRVALTEDKAYQIKQHWLNAWPEARAYFEHINKQCEAGGGRAFIEQFLVKRFRGDLKYTAACNTLFQGLGADVAKRAAWLLVKECHWGRLRGSHPVNFIHDQFLVETPDDAGASDRAHLVAEIMVEAGRQLLGDLAPKVEPKLCRRWSKRSKAIRQDGKLVPWDTAETYGIRKEIVRLTEAVNERMV